MPAEVPYEAVEEHLLLAATQPEALHAVVLLIWSSLVPRADSGAAETATPAAEPAGPQVIATPPPPLSAPWSAAAAAAAGLLSPDDQTQSLSFPKSRLEHTMVGTAAAATASASRGAAGNGTEDAASSTPSSFLGDTEATSPALFTAATSMAMGPGLEWAGLAASAARSERVVGLSPLTLRVLLWWAGRPQLPSRRAAFDGATDDVALSSGSAASFIASTTTSISAGGSLTRRACEDARALEAAVALGRPAHDQSSTRHPFSTDAGVDGAQLRHRIAEIFAVLCARDGGVVVSDALLHGRCHDASQMAAQRCGLHFAPCPDARWLAATDTAAAAAAAPPITVPSKVRQGDGRSSSSAVGGVRAAKSAARRGAGAYDITPLLCALVDLHTSAARSGSGGVSDVAAAAARTAQTPSHRTPVAGRVEAGTEADAVATGKLLRALLRCLPLHKRLVRLFNGDPRAMRPPARRGDASPSLFSASSSPRSSAPPPDAEKGVPVRDLASFAGVLTHPSPVVSSEAWPTLMALLFPAPSRGICSAVRRLLLLPAPRCPVQRLLISALALPGDDDADHQTGGPVQSAPPSPPLVLAASHPVARNAALRLLHHLCASTDLPPSVQAVFQGGPALLWRVLRLAAVLCRGVPAASAVLVRCVLVDYVVCAAPLQQQRRSDSRARPRVRDAAASPTTGALLHANKAALTAFLAATRTAWGCDTGGVAAVPDEDGVAGAAMHISPGVGYDEGDIAAILQSL